MKDLSYKSVIYNSPHGFACHKMICNKNSKLQEYRITDVNPAFETLIEIKADKIIGKVTEKVFAKLSCIKLEWDTIFEEVRLSGTEKSFEIYVKQTKKYYTVSVLLPEKDYFVTIFTDITEYKKPEKLQLAGEKKYQLILESTLEVIITFDITGKILYVNSQIEKEYGYIPEQVIGKSFRKFVPNKEVPRYLSTLKNLFINKKVDSFKSFVFHKDGRVIPVEMSSRVCKNKDNQFALAVIRDITKQQITEQALKQSKEKFESMVLNIPGIIYRCANDKHWTMEYISDEVERMTGFSASDFINNRVRNYSDIIHPEDVEFVDKAVQKCVNEKQTFEIEYRIKDIKNDILWVYEKGKGVYNNRGELQFLDGAIFNITDRKIAQQALKESEQKYKMLVQNQGEGIGIMDKNEVFRFVNPAAEKIFGVKEGELLNESITKFLSQESIKYIKKETQKREKGQISSYEVEIIQPSGNIVNLLVTASPQTDENNDFLGTFGVFRDITNRKKAEDALRETELRWEFAVDGSDLGLWDWNTVTDKVFFSKQWKAMLGFKEDEISGNLEEWDKRVHPDDKVKVYADIKKHLDGETSIYLNEHRVLCKDGTYKWILDRGKIVSWTDDNRPERMIGTHTDITERKEAEITLIKNEKELRKLNATKDKFFSIIAHDLKGPIGSLLSFADIFKDKFHEYDASDQRGFLSMIHNRVSDIYNLLENLLIWSRTQAKTIKFNPRKENLYNISIEVIDLLIQMANDKEITIQNNIPKDINIFVDKNMISTIFRNLISNAVKFTPRSGNIIISASYKKNDKIQDSIEISVKDNGVGIEPEIQSQLFDITNTASTKGTENETGTGLGLIICKDFVRKHKGDIYVESEINKGSTFFVSLPYNS